MTIRQTIERLLDATAQATALKVRVDRLRTDLTAEAERQLAEQGAAPAWSVRGLGKVRLDGVDAPRKARVTDPEAFGSWVAEHNPEVATAVVELEPEHLERALASFEFLGIPIKGARVDVDPGYATKLLEGLELTIAEGALAAETVTAYTVHPDTGLVDEVPGIGALPAPAHRLVVNLDPDRKRQAEHDAAAELDAEEGDARAAAEAAEEEPEHPLDDDPPHTYAPGPPLTREDVARAIAGGPLLDPEHRNPYVGQGADGARRSAQIDREEVDTLPTGPHQPGWSEATEERRNALLASAERWEVQAGQLDDQPPAGTPAPEVAADVEAALKRIDPARGRASDGRVVNLSDAEVATVARFEEGALSPEDLDADQAEERRAAVEAEPITLEVQDASVATGAVIVPDESPAVGVVRDALLEASGTDDPLVASAGSPAAAAGAREVLAATVRTPHVLESAKVDQLRHLAELAGLKLPKARLGKAALAQLINDRLAATEASQ